MEPAFAQGKVFIKDNMQALKDELLLYPRGKHDDLLDGLYYAMKKVYKPNHKAADNVKNEQYREKISNNEESWLLA